MSTGMNKNSGRRLEGLEHLHQSVADILSTPIGTRVMNRDYGSELPNFIDASLTQQTLVDIYAATAKALRRWEPRLRVRRVQASISNGTLLIDLTADYLPDGREITLDRISIG